MKDPDEIHDTEPMADPTLAEGDVPSDAVTERNDTAPDVLDGAGTEPDTEALLLGLEATWLRDRRRKELVRRASSDGAAFAVYACKARPAERLRTWRPEAAAVEVQQADGPEWPALTEARERDAPTMVKPRESGRRTGSAVLWMTAGLVATGAAIAASARRAPATESMPSGAAVAVPTLATPVVVERVEGPESVLAPVPPESAGGVAAPNVMPPRAPASRKTAPTPAPIQETRAKRERDTATSAGPAKDQYFEAP
jgi:hypothetical protein